MTYAKRICEICEQAFRPTYGAQRTCSRTCGGRLNLSERHGWPTCEVRYKNCKRCTALFVSKASRTYCGTCPPPSINQRPRQSEIAACRICHNVFAFLRITNVRAVCDTCLVTQRKIDRKNAKHRRRLRISTTAERINAAEIFARDRFTCRLCHKRLAMTKAVPHPKAPTLDHVLPLAHGGDHSRANVQAAHFICNSLKAAGGGQQLALIG